MTLVIWLPLELLDAMSPFIEWIEVESKVEVCRDPGDNFILALAKDGQADYIVTGDKDLMELSLFENIVILTMSELLLIIGHS